MVIMGNYRGDLHVAHERMWSAKSSFVGVECRSSPINSTGYLDAHSRSYRILLCLFGTY